MLEEKTNDYRIFVDNFGIKQKVIKKNASIPIPLKSEQAQFDNLFLDEYNHMHKNANKL